MQTKIQKWGNSYAVRLPKQIVVQLGWKAGSAVQIDKKQGSVVMKPAPIKQAITFQDWNKYLIPTGRKGTRHISDRVDEILYGKTDR